MGDAIGSQPKSAEKYETEAGLPSNAGEMTCILNGAAGSNRAIKTKEQLAELFSRHGAKARILLARNGPELSALARRAVEDRCGTVVAGGGDGTINAVAGV